MFLTAVKKASKVFLLNQATEVLTAIPEESSIRNYRDSETILSAYCTFSTSLIVRNVPTYYK